MTWDNVFNGSTRGGIPEAWGVSGYPTVYVLDAQGVIRATGGAARGERLARTVEALLAEGAGDANAGN